MSAETKNLKCGLIMPISAIDGCSEGHWDDVRSIIKEAMADTQFSVELVSDSNEIGIIQKRIVQNIYDNDIVICDVSAKNPNVMFELGMRLAFDKPAIIIKDDKTNYSFDTANIEHLQYPRDLHYHAIQAFKQKLREKVIATYLASMNPEYTTFLKHFGQFVVAKIDEKPVGKDEYLLEAVSELRNEVRAIAKIQRIRHTNPSRNSLHSNPFETDVIGADYILPSYSDVKRMAPFVSAYLERMKEVEIDELKDTSSAAFNEMFERYRLLELGRSEISESEVSRLKSALLTVVKAIAV